MSEAVIYDDNINKISFEPLYCIGGYITYEVLISTNGFSGQCNFCIEELTVQDHIISIQNMLGSLSGEMIVRDCESDAYLKFFFENNMNFYVSGQIGGSYEENMLKFKLKADQTVLLGLKNSLLNY